MLCTMTSKITPVVQPLWDVEQSCASLRSRNSIQRVLLKPTLSVQVIIYLTLSGPGCFWPNKGTSLPKTFFTKITRALFDLRRMVEPPAGRSPGTSTFCYFFMQDRFESEGISVVYCPTDEMLANFFTKPLQGSLFRKFRAVLLGHCHVNTLTKSPLPPSEERVENPILEKGSCAR